MNKDSSPNNIIGKPKKNPIRPDLLQALIDNADHCFSVAEREGDDTILLYVNKAFERMTGYTSDESLYKDCRFLQREDKQPHTNRKIRQAIEDEESVRVVLRNYKKDGTLFWNELTITPYFDKVDKVMYYIGVQRDLGTNIDNLESLDEDFVLDENSKSK